MTYQKLSQGVDLSCFDCSDEDKTGVNEFIHREALKYQEEKMGVTYLFYHDDDIVAYVTVSMTCIDNRDAPDQETIEWFEKKKPPAMLIGQLGVDNNWRNKGVGSYLCDWCYGLAASLSGRVGCRYLVLHTKGTNTFL